MGGFVKIGRSTVWRDDFKESDHPRANNGQFGSGGGSPADKGNEAARKEAGVQHPNPAKAGAEAARSEGNPQDRLNKAMKAHETLKRQYHNDYDGDFNSPEAKKVKGELDKAKAEMETAQAEVKNGSEGKKIVRKGLFGVDYEK